MVSHLARDPGFVVFNNEARFKLLVEGDGELDPEVAISQLKSYPGKELQGDPTVADHDYLSTWGISDLTGGLGIFNHRQGQTDQRFREATAEVSRPGNWTNPMKVRSNDLGANVVVLGDLFVSSTMYAYCAVGTDIYRFDDAATAPADTGQNLGAVPLREGTPFTGTGGTLKLYIPLGLHGYCRYDGTTATDVAAAADQPAAVDFCVFGGTILLCIDTVGQIWKSIDGSTWTKYTDMKIDPWFQAFTIEEYRDVAQEVVANISTSGGIFVFDPAGPQIYRSGYRFPRSSLNGRSAVVHQDLYYVAAGLDIRQTGQGSGDTSVGPSRDDGLGVWGRGAYVKDLASEYNDLYCLCSGDDVWSPAAQLLRWDGIGWFRVWTGVLESGLFANNLTISTAGDDYFVTWGAGDYLYRQRIPIGDRNPATVLYTELQTEFEASSWLLTGVSNKGMPGSDKVGVSAALRCYWVGDFDLVPQFPSLSYSLSSVLGFTSVGGPVQVITHPPDLVIPAAGTVGEMTLIYWLTADFTGLHYEEIEFRIGFTEGLVIKWFAEYFIKQMAGSFGWSFTVDLRNPVDERSPEWQDQYITNMFLDGGIQLMSYAGVDFYVGLTSWAGSSPTGMHEDRGYRTITAFQVVAKP